MVDLFTAPWGFGVGEQRKNTDTHRDLRGLSSENCFHQLKSLFEVFFFLIKHIETNVKKNFLLQS